MFTLKDASGSFEWVFEGGAFENSGVSAAEFVDSYVSGYVNGTNYSEQSDDELIAEFVESGERAEMIAFAESL